MRPGPLLKNRAACKSPPGQALEETLQTRRVISGRAGEEGQVTVAVSIIFVQVQVNNRNLLGQSIQETPEVISRGFAKIGVAEVKTHPRMRKGQFAALLQLRKEAIEIFRTREHGVFQRKLEAGFGAQQQRPSQRFNESLRTLAKVQVQVQQCGANFGGELDRAVKTAVLGVAQRIEFQRGVHGKFHALRRGGLTDIATGLLIQIPLVPSTVTGKTAVGEKLEGGKSVRERKLERVH